MRFKTKTGLLIISLLICSLIIPTTALGISVSPGKVQLDFEPGKVYEGIARFGTDPRRTSHIKLIADGEFDIILDKDELFCDREPCQVNYKIIMPESFDKPGGRGAFITATEVFEEEQTGMINVIVSMKMSIKIFVPYPGKYLEFMSLTAKNKPAGGEIPFTAVLESRGEEVINSATGSIFIYDRNGERVGLANTNTWIDIQPGTEIRFLGSWDSGDNEIGRYSANMIVTYDGLETNRTTNFKVGGLDVELMNYTKEILIGGIKPFYLDVESIWSEDITNMKADVAVLNETAGEITSFPTLTQNLPPWGTATLEGYLDTTMLNLSDYDIKVTLFFENLTKEYDGVISIIEETVPEEPKESWLKKFLTTRNILILIIILLLIILAIIIYFFIPKKKKFKKAKIKKKT